MPQDVFIGFGINKGRLIDCDKRSAVSKSKSNIDALMQHLAAIPLAQRTEMVRLLISPWKRTPKLIALGIIEGGRAELFKDELSKLAKDEIAEVRWRAAEILGNVKTTPTQLLQSLLGDASELVRVSTIEAVAQLGRRQLGSKVRELLLQDKSYLVRSAAADALPQLASAAHAAAILNKAIVLEKNTRVRLAIEAGLLYLNQGRLDRLTKYLTHKNYVIRCAAVNYGLEMASKNDRLELLRYFKSALRIEKTRAVRSTLRTAIKEIEAE